MDRNIDRETVESIINECIADKLGTNYDKSAELTASIFNQLHDTLSTQYRYIQLTDTHKVSRLKRLIETTLIVKQQTDLIMGQQGLMDTLNTQSVDQLAETREQGNRIDSLYPTR